MPLKDIRAGKLENQFVDDLSAVLKSYEGKMETQLAFATLSNMIGQIVGGLERDIPLPAIMQVFFENFEIGCKVARDKYDKDGNQTLQ
jgi:hypothetical protein